MKINMVVTQLLKYFVLLFFTFEFNLLTTHVYALNIGAETTGVAVSVVCIFMLLNYPILNILIKHFLNSSYVFIFL